MQSVHITTHTTLWTSRKIKGFGYMIQPTVNGRIVFNNTFNNISVISWQKKPKTKTKPMYTK
jgi:hypothetical protein